MTKYTNEQWEKLSREEKREALLKFQEPENIYNKEYININVIDKQRFN